MLMIGKIQLEGSFEDKGFGLLCMKQADEFNIKGRFEYQNNLNVKILLVGPKDTIQVFFDWCLKQHYSKSGSLVFIPSNKTMLKEFQIINQL